MPKPNLAPLYGAAFGFTTDRLVKPVHFATGFFLSLTEKNYPQRTLNFTVALPAAAEPEGAYTLPAVEKHLREMDAIAASVTATQLHSLRKHLRVLANNDGAVFAAYGKKGGFGCDYTTSSQEILTRTKDNDGFSGFFVNSVLTQTSEGGEILVFAHAWFTQAGTTTRNVLSPLLDQEHKDEVVKEKYEKKFATLEPERLKRIAELMQEQTAAVLQVCKNAEESMALESRLRSLLIALGAWLFSYLKREGLGGESDRLVLLADMTGESTSRMRKQSRWSYLRLREALTQSFARFASEGRFAECEEAWHWVETELEGRPKLEDLYRTIALRNGLAQPRGGNQAKHFELQPDTLRVLVNSVLAHAEELVPITNVLERLFSVWNLSFGGRADDGRLLAELGYAGLDQDHDLTPNTEALIDLMTELGLATRYSDGLVMCHSKPTF